MQDLTAFSNVTRIEVVNVTDGAGLVCDDCGYDFTATAPVPLPAGGLLMLTALGGVAALRRKS
ncbi:VPLPA-CTERM sorting domain-containing protein [Primorskyibacter sp. S187A]|uniref:VPLPA-CTERM sorting domain-containing protein n=1 Tax=Primorskyibacter sp. S187A TaxID=3415130 RepID=UPI003C7C1147